MLTRSLEKAKKAFKNHDIEASKKAHMQESQNAAEEHTQAQGQYIKSLIYGGLDGTITVMNAGETTPSEIGNIETARFANAAGLTAIGKNLFLESETSGSPTTGTPGEDGLGTITQGFLEMSNVNIVEEMVYMILAQRAYEINGKAIQTADEMLQMANNVKR